MRKITTEELIKRKGDLSQLKKFPRPEIYLILENIRSMYNVGAIFRTADAAGIKKIYLCGITAYPPRKEIEKTALKTIEYVSWEYCKSAQEVVLKLKNSGVKIVALEQTDTSHDYLQFDFKAPVAIVIGHETEGVTEDLLSICDEAIEIPMRGIANSLNVATAAGIILYKATEKL